MSEWNPINLNDRVKVVLRERGAEVLNKRMDQMRKVSPNTSWPSYKVGDTFEAGLWEIAQKFGPAMQLGLDTPIETAIEFRRVP